MLSYRWSFFSFLLISIIIIWTRTEQNQYHNDKDHEPNSRTDGPIRHVAEWASLSMHASPVLNSSCPTRCIGEWGELLCFLWGKAYDSLEMSNIHCCNVLSLCIDIKQTSNQGERILQNLPSWDIVIIVKELYVRLHVIDWNCWDWYVIGTTHMSRWDQPPEQT